MIRRLQDGDDPESLKVYSKLRFPRKVVLNWFLQVHREATISGLDSLFTLREMTDGGQELEVVVPRGGVSFWYQLTAPCMPQYPGTASEAAARLAFTKIKLDKQSFPSITKMFAEFKTLQAKLFMCDPKGIVEDGVSYSFKGKSPRWSFEVEASNPERDNQLVAWADRWGKRLWDFLRTDTRNGLAAHPITVSDPQCLGQVLLRRQSLAGDIADVSQLLKLGVPVEASNDQTEGTPLLEAVYGKQLGTFKILLSAGANPHAIRQRDGRNAIHMLVMWGRYVDFEEIPERFEIGRLLLEKGVQVDLPDQEGITPLMASIEDGDPPLAAWLVKHGADPDRKDKAGVSARDRAVASGKKRLLSAISK